jgi:hypothetical protein
MEEQKKTNWIERNIVWIALIAGGATISLLLYGYREYLNWSFKIEPSLISPFGDFLSGFLGAVFGMITIYLVYQTFKSQKEELSLSRDLIKRQSFEITFFNLLQQKKEVTNSLNHSNASGLDLIKVQVIELAHSSISSSDQNTTENQFSFVKDSFLVKEYNLYHTYFANILQVANYINSSGLTDDLKEIYYQVLENSLSYFEKITFITLALYMDIFKKDETYIFRDQLIIFKNNVPFMKTGEMTYLRELKRLTEGDIGITI